VLREYLALELKPPQVQLSFEWDQERIYDDFVFMCFFVGEWSTCCCLLQLHLQPAFVCVAG
jgi:5'-3' exonuclease